jgi:O-acetyl-ADP-ribose deacetylase
VLNILEAAKKLEISSVSIPAISSGIFGFPKPKCAEIMMLYTMAWFKRGDCGKVTRVRMCNFD